MTCKSCGAEIRSNFTAEIAIHFPGRSGIDKPIVWVFPRLWVCPSCGQAEFNVTERELHVLTAQSNTATEDSFRSKPAQGY